MRGDPRFGILRRPRQAAGVTRTGDVMSNRHAAMLAAVSLLCVPAVAAAPDRQDECRQWRRGGGRAPAAPGTGTTDAIVGAHYREALADLNASWFVQLTADRSYAVGVSAQF
jgi:hypothetical protein